MNMVALTGIWWMEEGILQMLVEQGTVRLVVGCGNIGPTGLHEVELSEMLQR